MIFNTTHVELVELDGVNVIPLVRPKSHRKKFWKAGEINAIGDLSLVVVV